MRDDLSKLIQEADIPVMNGQQLTCVYAIDTVGANVLADHLIANGVRLQSKQVTSDKASDENKRWIPVTERLPENEVPVLILAERRCYSVKHGPETKKIVAMAFHTDGKMNTEDSGFIWELWDTGAEYDEEADAYIIPEGWWESVVYGEEFAAVDDFVTHWMPLPTGEEAAK